MTGRPVTALIAPLRLGGPALLGAVLARGLPVVLHAAPPGGAARWQRTNHRGRGVSLLGGPAVALAATAAATVGARPGLRRTTAALGTVCGLVGAYDDLSGSRPGVGSTPGLPTDKGFAGHLGALRAGRVSTGAVKLGVVGLAGLLAGTRVAGTRPADTRLAYTGGERGRVDGPIRGRLDAVVAGAVIAGAANLVNLLDLRPGRALKAVVLAGLPLLGGAHGPLLAGPLGAAVATLPADLGERVMIGDTGANPLGALLGLRLALAGGPGRRRAALAVLLVLNLASERVSFTTVIEATPGLRRLDALGRRASTEDPVPPARPAGR